MEKNNRVMKIVDTLTMDEKFKLLVGKDSWTFNGVKRLGVSEVLVTDGPHGLRKKIGDYKTLHMGESVLATCFPPACTSACSFNEKLIFQMGKAMGEECRKEGVSVLLGPGVNIKRNPLCGRNFEYFSEDPYVAGKIGAAMIRGVQSVGVGTSLKHFAANNQEHARLVTDSIIDERALREIYLKAFEICVKEAKPWTIMAAYNLVNGVYCCANEKLLTNILRKEWKYNGLVMSDWGAVDHPVKDIKAGLDVQMPGPARGTYRILQEAYESKKISKKEIDLAVRHIISLSLKVDEGKKNPYLCDMEKNLRIAQAVAEESMVLLKNEGLLPLEKNKMKTKIAIIGEFAKKSRYQGAGSSVINPYKLDSLCEAFDDEQIEYEFSSGYSLNKDLSENEKKEFIKEAIEVSKKSDVVIVVAGLPESYESEGFDRTTIQMPIEQNQLIHKLCNNHKNVIVVLQTGSVIEMPWIEEPKAVLLSYLGGCQGGKATRNILFGNVNPSGKLAETFVKSEKVTPNVKNYPGKNKRAEYLESIFVGYRYYDFKKKDVEFPFGYGLSYTKFSYKNMKVVKKDKKVFVSFEMKNIGKKEGKETVFIFIGKENSDVMRPIKELKRFKKVLLERKEKKEIEIELTKEDFEFYCVEKKRMIIEPGEYKIFVSSDAHSVELTGKINIENKDYEKRESKIPLSYKKIANGFTRKDFYELLKKTPNKKKMKRYSMNSTIDDIKDTWIGKGLIKTSKYVIENLESYESEKRMIEASVTHMPLRQLTMQGFSYGQVRLLVKLLNYRIRK